MANAATDYEFDVALSFAGEQRPYVERVAEALKVLGVSVFYDAYERAALWGKNLYDHLDEIYRTRARFVVLFVSAEYAVKVWTNHERKSAQARALEEKGEYILPARFDDTEVPGVLPTMGYVDLGTTTPEELARLIVEKIGMSQAQNGAMGTDAAATGPARPGETGLEWIAKHRAKALSGLQDLNKADFYEVAARIEPALETATQLKLDQAVATANIHTFGWPIGIHFVSGPGRPRPVTNGIVAEYAWVERGSYDCWALSLDGQFYLLKTLSEDALGREDAILFNTRIVRVAETLMFLRNVYEFLGADPASTVTTSLRHVGLDHRTLSASGRRKHTMLDRQSLENEAQTQVQFRLDQLDRQLIDLVKAGLNPVFALFDFYQPADELYDQIVSDFIRGQVT